MTHSWIQTLGPLIEISMSAVGCLMDFFGDEAAQGKYLTGSILHLTKTRFNAVASWFVVALVTGRGI